MSNKDETRTIAFRLYTNIEGDFIASEFLDWLKIAENTDQRRAILDALAKHPGFQAFKSKLKGTQEYKSRLAAGPVLESK